MSQFKIHFAQLVEDYKTCLNSLNASEYSSEQKYVNKCTDLLETYRGYIFNYVFKNTTEETFFEAYFQSFPYCTELQLSLEKHVEKFLR